MDTKSMRRKQSSKNRKDETIPLMLQANPTSDDGEDGQEEDGDLQWLNIVVNPDQHARGTSLILTDALLLILHYLQVLALLQSLSLRWPWPETWFIWGRYLFLFNLDVWEFLKVYEVGVFKYVQNYEIPSQDVLVDYMHLMAAWGGFLLLLMLIYVGCYVGFFHRKSAHMLVRLAKLKKFLIVILQVLALPVGVALGRLFHCTSLNYVDVKNELLCFQDIHWAYIGPALVVLLLVFIIFPAWLIVRTKDELLEMSVEKHEAYLQLKEMEYVHGIDATWLIGNFHIFASFKKRAVHFRAVNLLLFAILLILYAGLYQYLFYQAVFLTVLLFTMFLSFMFLRPFRIKSFNHMLSVSYLCLGCNALVGCFKTSINFSEIQSPWLLPHYQLVMLSVVNGLWVLYTVIFLVYIVARLACCEKKCGFLWPNSRFEKLSPETRKYMRGVIISKLLLEKTLSVPAMFAPIHEVARYIHIINAYCREAELTRDPLQATLWDVLDQLIEVHTNVAPKCLFAESVKDSIRKTSSDLLKLLPAFARRLAQREYDYVLVHPVKRRILLKLYCLSLLLKGQRSHRKRDQLTTTGVLKIWQRPEDTEESDPGYYEDMYPPRDPLISHQTRTYDTEVLVQLEEEIDDEAVIEETEIWLQKHGLVTNNNNVDDWTTREDTGSRLSMLSPSPAPGSTSGHHSNRNRSLRPGSSASVMTVEESLPGAVREDVTGSRPQSGSRPHSREQL